MNVDDIPLACIMDAIPEAEREGHVENTQQLWAQATGIDELANGYRMTFPNVADNFNKVAQFIALERLCCPFLTFVIEVQAGSDEILLSLTGREGVKAFIREEFSMDS